MPNPLLPGELLGARVSVLLEVAYAGGTLRWSDGDAPTDAPGPYLAMSPVDVEIAFQLLQQSPDVRAIPVTFDFPREIDVPALVEQGHDLAAASAEVSLYVAGRAYVERLVLVRGLLSEPIYNSVGRVTASVTENPYDDSAVFPPASATVCADTWTDYDEAVEGRVYPYPIGTPGVYTDADNVQAYTTGAPGLLVDVASRTLLISGAPVVATTVKVFKLTGTNSPVSASLTVSHGPDLLGRTVATVTLPAGPGGPTAEEGQSYWVRWTTGGIRERSGSRSLRGAGELLLWLAERSSLRLDLAAWGTAAAFLDRYRISGYIDDFVRPWDLMAEILALLPVSLIVGPSGLVPVVWRYDAGPADVVAHLTDGVDFDIEEGISYEGRDIANEIAISFAPRADTGEYLRTRAITGRPAMASENTRNTIRNAHSRASYDTFGSRAGESIATDWIHETGTADQVLRWKAAFMGFPRRVVQGTADASLAWLTAGSVVAITSARYSLSYRIGIVSSVSYAGRLFRVSIVLIRQPSTLLPG